MKKVLLSFLLIFAAVVTNQISAQIIFNVESPLNLAGNYPITYAQNWGGFNMDTIALTDTLVLVDDGTAADSLGCNTLVNASQIAGKIAVVYRGACEFGMKALQAQNAGAVGVVIINHSGEPIAMGGGAVGSQVTIPVIMISTGSGVTLRPALDAGTLVAFIGNKTGLFGDDIGFYKEDVIVARSFAVPTYMVNDVINIGAWIRNYGYDEQKNVKLKAEVSIGSTVLYTNTSAGTNVLPGDSIFYTLPTFSRNGLAAGYYSLTYTTFSDSIDAYTGDNSVVTSFWINDSSIYSKSGFYPDSLVPRMTGGSASSTSGNDFGLCVIMDETDYAGKAVTGLSFGAGVQSGSTLIGKALELQFYKWDFIDTAAGAFNDAQRLDDGNAFYDYTAELSYDFVRQDFTSPIQLVNGEKYVACIYNYNDSLFLGTDTQVDYSQAEVSYGEFFAPIYIAGSWSVDGFSGSTNPAALLIHLGNATGIENNNVSKVEVTPYPNPAVDFVSIPLKNASNGNVQVEIFDLTGKLVKSENVNMMNTRLFKVNTTSIENGTYLFNLKFEDHSTSSFRVVIAK